MLKLIRVEKNYSYYTVDVTEEQVLKAKKSDKDFESLLKLVSKDMKLDRSEEGEVEYYIGE
tara:strand:+ start:64 stop:246 length:183 start_codon:yes stop_codon:yes gene_type:complete